MAETAEKKAGVLDHIMNGIGFMLPCVVAGGVLMGIGFMLDDYSINPENYGHNTVMANYCTTTGQVIFGFMLPVLAAFIGQNISGNGAIAAGLTGGMMAVTGGSGFLGALLAGFIAGYTVKFLKKFFDDHLQKIDDTLRNLLLFPLISVAVMGAISLWILDPVVGGINQALNDALKSMSGASSILLGAIVGGMESVDMGGPINKTAYLLATASLANGEYSLMSAVLAGGIIPPYVTAFASQIFKSKFTKVERATGMSNFVIGLAGITEAAIPFAATDPMRVIPCCVAGSVVAGALSMALGCSVMAPFGGLFILPLNTNPLGFIIAMASGVAVGTILLGLTKKKVVEE